jgi:phosphomannomutase
VLSFALEGGSRVMLRPSGTEPKIKYYFDLRVDVDPSVSMELSLAQARAHLATFILAFREGCRARGVVGG